MEIAGIELKYRAPRTSEPGQLHPSFVLLHGYGSNEDDLFSFERFFPNEAAVFSLRAPLPLPQGGNAWFSIDFDRPRSEWSNNSEALDSVKRVRSVLELLPTFSGLELSKPVLVGFSQGSILSLAVVLDAPGMIRGAALFSGYWNHPLSASIPSSDQIPPLWASHGEQDAVIPISWPDSTYEMLRNEHGIVVDYHRFPWLGHGIDADAFNSFRQWLSHLQSTTSSNCTR